MKKEIKIKNVTKRRGVRCRSLAALILCILCAATQMEPVYASGRIFAEKDGTASPGASVEAIDKTEMLEELYALPGDVKVFAADEEAEEDEGAQPEEATSENSPEESGQETEGEGPSAEDPDSGQETGEPQEPGDSQETGEPQEPNDSDKLPVPKKVTGLRTTRQSDKKVLLAWDESEGAETYEVYRRTGSGSYKKLDEVKTERYVDKTIVYGKTYRYRIIPVNADGAAGAAAAITFSHTQAVNILTQKYTFRQMETDMKELAKAYSDYCELTSIGISVEGRTIYDFAIGNPNAGRSLLVVSTLHAREYICSAVLMREIEYYLRNYNKTISGTKPADVLNDMQIHYIVMANPDGVTISQTSYARWKANSRGVDLNRNFPAKKFVVGGKKGSEGYSGKKALSEPESKAVAALTKDLKKKQNLVGVVNYHAMGQIVFGDCSISKIKKATTTMYQIARALTGYRDAGGYSSGKASSGGQYREYVMDILGLPSITLEIGATSAPCSYWEYESAFQKNKLVVLKIAEAL